MKTAWFCLAALLTLGTEAAAGDDRAAQIGRLFSSLIAADEPGAAVLIVKDGAAVFELCRGVADIHTRRPIDSETDFRLASLTKQFTAAAVALLVRDGRLTYGSRLTEFFPAFPAYGKDMTVRHLLQHTSGLPDYESLMPPPDPSLPVEDQQISDLGVLELLQQATAAKFTPGSQWDYSNSGYVLLGLIVEKVSGRPFGRFLEERIFSPLGMTGTVVYERGLNNVPRRAYGHTRNGGTWRRKDQSPTSATRGDGRVYSSLRDLAKWEAALCQGTLLTPEEIRDSLEPVRVSGPGPVEPDGTPASYGFGWFLNPWKGRRRAWHYGETAGFRTAIHRFPDDKVAVIVLCNRDDLDASALALKAVEPFLE